MAAARQPGEGTNLRPKDFLEAPKGFGTRPDARWVVGPDTPLQLLAAAWLQHQAALVVQYEAIRSRAGVVGLARKLGRDGNYLRRKLNGERWATVRDLAEWIVEVGYGVLPRLQSDHDVFPPPEFTISPDESR